MSTPETPAEVMRRAAGLMRERATELPPGPWRAEGRDVTATQDYHGDDWNPDWDFGFNVAVCRRQDEAEHIAAWSPLAALAVADLLEREAALIDAQVFPQSDPAMERYPLAVARAYLGETPGMSTPITATGGQEGNEEGTT